MKETQAAFGRRIGAALFDIFLWFVLFVVAAVNFGEKQISNTDSGTTVMWNLSGLPFLIFVSTLLIYFIVMEWRLGGTIGKQIFKVRVVSADKTPLTFQQCVVRNLLRIIDAFPYFMPYAIGLAVAASSERRQRIGDKVAGTLVIKR